MPGANRHIRIGLIVEDKHCDAYREFTQKIWPERARGYPLRKNKSIPATRKLRAWIEQIKDKYDFVFVLVDLDTPAHHKDPQYFQQLKRICDEEEAALLVVKRELESWILADANCIARWKLGHTTRFFFKKVYHNTAREPWKPKAEILKLVKQVVRHRNQREPRTFDPQWTVEIAKKVELNKATLSRNSSLRCFYNLVKGCCGNNGPQYFAAYPQEAHCDHPEIPD
jgi:hypothetical protein